MLTLYFQRITTDLNTVTQTQTITNVVESTTTVTSSVNVVVTETPLPHKCPSPAVWQSGHTTYSTRFVEIRQLSSSTTAVGCCDLCWAVNDCVMFLWYVARDATTLGSCRVLSSSRMTSSPVSNTPAICPLGVDTVAQLDLGTSGVASTGPCDLTGLAYAQS